MAQRSSKRNRLSRKDPGAPRRRVVGLGAAAAGFLAAATTPLANAPAAHADGFDLILEPIINSIAGSLTGLVDPLTSLDAVSGVDPLAGLALPAADLAASTGNLGASAADSTLAAASDPTSAASSFDTMLQTLAQEWISSQSGAAYDAQLNTLWHDFGGSGILIGNGANRPCDDEWSRSTGGVHLGKRRTVGARNRGHRIHW